MKRLLILLSITAGLLITGCSSEDEGHSHGEGANHSHNQSAQQAEHGHEHSEASEHEGDYSNEGEESDKELALNETYDEVRKGVRLMLSHNSDKGAFIGSVENTTQEALPQVRVEVHLSNGTELGPTTPVDLESGERQTIELNASGENFDSWTAHSKLGNSEHSHGENSDHSHDN